ncbi:MAG: hypothetical protein GXN95_05710 [Methanococci archaeon]|nr:hypothetical protein [Methanococci archaeon]
MEIQFIGEKLDNITSYNAEDCLFIPFNKIDIAKFDLSIVYLPSFFKDLTSYSANQSSIFTILKDIKIKEVLENEKNHVVVIDPYFKNISKGKIVEHYLMKHLTRDKFVVRCKEGETEEIIVKNKNFKLYSELIGNYGHIYEIEDEDGKIGIVDTLSLICDYEHWDYEVVMETSEGEILGVRIFRNGELYILHPPNENFKNYEKLVDILKEIL